MFDWYSNFDQLFTVIFPSCSLLSFLVLLWSLMLIVCVLGCQCYFPRINLSGNQVCLSIKALFGKWHLAKIWSEKNNIFEKDFLAFYEKMCKKCSKWKGISDFVEWMERSFWILCMSWKLFGFFSGFLAKIATCQTEANLATNRVGVPAFSCHLHVTYEKTCCNWTL